MKESVSTPLVTAIEFAWSSIQENHESVPDVVVTLGSGLVRQGMKLGHFAANVWTRGESDVHELFVGGEGLARGAEAVMATLLHEASHAWAEANEIKDTSRQGRYHNDKFRMIGETFGLKLQKDSVLGWSASEMSDEARELYSEAIFTLDLALTAYRKLPKLVQVNPTGTPTGTGTTPTTGPASNNGVSAKCGCGRRIRVSHTTYGMGDILCGICGEAFK
jgi:hypothetical protein